MPPCPPCEAGVALSSLVLIELFAGILTASHALEALGMSREQVTTLYSECEPRLLDQARARHPDALPLRDVVSVIQPGRSDPSSIKLTDDI